MPAPPRWLDHLAETDRASLPKAGSLIMCLDRATKLAKNTLYPTKEQRNRFCPLNYDLGLQAVLFLGTHQDANGRVVTRLSVPSLRVNARFFAGEWVQASDENKTDIVAGPRFFRSTRRNGLARDKKNNLTGMKNFAKHGHGFTSGVVEGYRLDLRANEDRSASKSIDSSSPPIHVDYDATLTCLESGLTDLFEIRYEVRTESPSFPLRSNAPPLPSWTLHQPVARDSASSVQSVSPSSILPSNAPPLSPRNPHQAVARHSRSSAQVFSNNQPDVFPYTYDF